MTNNTTGVLITLISAILFLALLFGPIIVSVYLANYNFLWLWVLLLFMTFPSYKGEEIPQLTDAEIAEAFIREVKRNPIKYKSLMSNK